MMNLKPVDAKEYERLRPSFAPLDHYLTLPAIFAGSTPGRVYADDPADPRLALAWYGHRLYLTGDPTTAVAPLRRFWQDTMQPALTAADIGALVVYTPPGWQDVVAEALAHLYPIPRRRFYYRLDARRKEWSYTVPAGFRLRPVDAALLADPDIDNLDWLTDEMVSERPSLDDFLAQSFGTCVQKGRKIAAWCLTEYNTGDRCELGIATDSDFRRQGLATLVGTAVIGEAAQRGVVDIGWVCWADNEGSVATAEKLGFRRVAEDTVHQLIFDPVIALAVRGNLAFGDGRYREAVDWYGRALRQGDAPAWIPWNAACAYARLNRPDPAFTHLHLAIDAGLDDWNFINTSPHFRQWRDTSAWQAIRQRLQVEIGD